MAWAGSAAELTDSGKGPCTYAESNRGCRIAVRAPSSHTQWVRECRMVNSYLLLPRNGVSNNVRRCSDSDVSLGSLNQESGPTTFWCGDSDDVRKNRFDLCNPIHAYLLRYRIRLKSHFPPLTRNQGTI